MKKLSMEALVDTLSEQTTLYLQMHTEGATKKEFQRCKLMLQAIQAEIKSRKDRTSKEDRNLGS